MNMRYYIVITDKAVFEQVGPTVVDADFFAFFYTQALLVKQNKSHKILY
jgi:hypothetical protein